MPHETQFENAVYIAPESEPEASDASRDSEHESGEPKEPAGDDASRDGEHESEHGKDLRLASYEALKPVLVVAIEAIERGGPPSVDVRHALDNFLDALRNVAVRDRA